MMENFLYLAKGIDMQIQKAQSFKQDEAWEMSPERSNMEAIVILEEQQRSEGASVAEGV